MEGPLKGNKGKSAGTALKDATYDDCAESCKENEKCNSIIYSEWKKECIFKTLELTGNEPITKKSPKYFSAYKTCEIGNYPLE